MDFGFGFMVDYGVKQAFNADLRKAKFRLFKKRKRKTQANDGGRG